MHDVFISYSTKDHVQAETVRNVLENNGIPCWMAPRDIPGGSNYTKEIPSAIRGCQVFVLILSENSQNSHWVLKELDSAVNCGKVILPFMLENCQLNDEFNFLLTGAQRYEAYQKKADSLEALISRIRAITGSQADTSVPSDAPVVTPKREENHGYLGLARCPACGGNDLEELKGKTGKYTFKENLIALLPVVFSVLFIVGASFILLIFLLMIAADGDVADIILTVGILGSMVGGFLFGNRKAKDIIRRQRVRSGLNPHPFRCTACQKEFLVKKD